MQLSKRTVQLLKNFSSINQSILVRQGNVLRTISPQKSVMARATVEENFSRDFGIYELSRLLGILTLFDEPEITLGENALDIRKGKQRLNYVYSDPSVFVTPPNKDITPPSVEATFQLPADDFQKLMRAVSLLQMPEVCFASDGQKVTVSAVNTSNPTADAFDIELPAPDSVGVFKAVLKVDNMKMIPSDYTVSVSKAAVAEFVTDGLAYLVAAEATASNFGA